MADGIDSNEMSDAIQVKNTSVETVDPYDKPMDPRAQEATKEQSNAYRKILEQQGVLAPKKTEEITDWIQVQKDRPTPPQIKQTPLPQQKEKELVEQSA